MGEKETMTTMPEGRTRHGITVTMDDDKGVAREMAGSGDVEKSVQWEPHKAPGLDLPEQELTTRHETVKNSIGNIR